MDMEGRARAAMAGAFELIHELHAPSDQDGIELKRIASKIAESRGLDPDSIVSAGPVLVLADRDGATTVAVIANQAQWAPAWKLFEADARLARDIVGPPAPPTSKERQYTALARAVNSQAWPGRAGQLAD